MWNLGQSILGGNEEDREEFLEDSDGLCNLSPVQRMYGFAACLVAGFACMLLSLIVFAKPIKFAVLFTFGNLLAVGSTAFLIGPVQQIRMMFDPVRIYATAIYIGFVVIALICALWIHNKILTIIAIICEICALICPPIYGGLRKGFADDTLIICDTNQEQLVYMNWSFMWFEAISGLKNVDKCELILIEGVENVEALTATLNVGWGNLPATYLVGKGSKIKFWKDSWCTGTPLSQCFNHLFVLAVHRDATIEEMWDQHSGQGDWNLVFVRDFNDWEMDMVGDLLHTLRGHRPSMEDDSVKWRQGRNGLFRVKEAYRLLDKPNATEFPARRIWVDRVPTKVYFFAWEATWGKVLTLDRLQKRGVGFSAWEATWRWILMIDQLKKRLVFSLFDVTWVMHFATRGNLLN
ncbi:Vesicle transport protein SFT2B [Vitis vinifera]|uniref:Vesicle transport protein n=1 Tax=Vitis vinifera TaxID=29760 RepID=A0A438DEG9_VITVI|nr:Vesicle transport protein SFT2B [Vitis vinifera]